ncbi:uncharacterized protein N7469_007583 [Penicillium citrinum]|uniref:Uncharacterized protein n=1 Tax=Penicillium citrinum TaxID=5077 RepID=A0A9W9NWQ4_PENCI|nr:uncharacterized protein N7469_007583 [Penicillium citrinum]KAJ5227577.1 hypothetical protein N7469_007583 [Penicillium citrinum]
MSEQPLKRVAVIGAGISGVVSAGHLLAAGLDVRVFERSKAAGGVWLYDKRVPIELQYPSVYPTSVEKFYEDERDENEKQRLKHAPPGPCYENLTNNVSTPLLRTKLNAWPQGTLPYVNHHVLKEYIQDTAKKVGVEEVTTYGALVTNVYKEEQKWNVRWRSLFEDTKTGKLFEKEESDTFDAIVVASGHYHTPLVPDIPGLAEAKSRWPDKIAHSKSFRNAEGFEGKNVLLIGGGVSSIDIAREISPVTRNIFQSTRNGAFDIPATALPGKASRVEEVTKFEIFPTTEKDETHLPFVAHLKSGSTLQDIDRIVLCTGYQMALPFFPQYNDKDNSSETALVTDGSQVHNLHHDIFYIPDPTLAFVGIPFYTATFTLFEFQAIAVAAVFSQTVRLPSKEDMRLVYREKIATKGLGRSFHSLKGEEEAYVKTLLKWVNFERTTRGLDPIEGHTATWLEEKKAQVERLTLIFQGAVPYGFTNSSSAEVKTAA